MLYFIFRKVTRLHGKNPDNPVLAARARTVDADLRQPGLSIQKSIVFFGERLFAEEGFDPDFFFRRHRDGRFCVGEKKGKTEKKIQNARHCQNDGKEREETAARLGASHAKISFFRNPTRFFLCLIVPGYEKNNKKETFLSRIAMGTKQKFFSVGSTALFALFCRVRLTERKKDGILTLNKKRGGVSYEA